MENYNAISLPKTANDFKTALRLGIEHFIGSQVKKDNRLNESLAKSLGYQSYNHLAPLLKGDSAAATPAARQDATHISVQWRCFDANGVFLDEADASGFFEHQMKSRSLPKFLGSLFSNAPDHALDRVGSYLQKTGLLWDAKEADAQAMRYDCNAADVFDWLGANAPHLLVGRADVLKKKLKQTKSLAEMSLLLNLVEPSDVKIGGFVPEQHYPVQGYELLAKAPKGTRHHFEVNIRQSNLGSNPNIDSAEYGPFLYETLEQAVVKVAEHTCTLIDQLDSNDKLLERLNPALTTQLERARRSGQSLFETLAESHFTVSTIEHLNNWAEGVGGDGGWLKLDLEIKWGIVF